MAPPAACRETAVQLTSPRTERRSLAWWRRGKTRAPEPTPEQVFLDHLDLIERAATSVARRSGFAEHDAEDFVSTVKLKLIEDDYAVLRKHRGESLMSTYLTTVVHHTFQDWRHQKWGRYRPSAKAKRLGPSAMHLEQLLVRDGHDLDTAIAMLQERRPESSVTAAELRDLAAQLPHRLRRVEVGEEALDNQPSAEDDAADRRVADSQRRDTAQRAGEILFRHWRRLPAADRLLLQMQFKDGCKVSTIARTLDLDQRSLYSRRDRHLAELRRACEAEGLTWGVVREILGWGETPLIDLLGSDLESEGASISEKSPVRPSKRDEGEP